MNILIAPDSFKDSIPAKDAAIALQKGILNAIPDAKIDVVPLADGGEGTVQAIVEATNGQIVKAVVHDPIMRKIESFFGIAGDGKTAIIEMAAASGIELLKKNERNPWITTTYGTGELIKTALKKNCNTILIGIGGSATNDCGAGMASALGVKLTDKNGNQIQYGGGNLGNVENIDISAIDKKIFETQFFVACDVSNPLTGKKGASFVYGPQKGADKKMVIELDKNLQHFASKIKLKLNKNVEHYPGAGAAGGLGAGLLAFLNAKLVKGFDLVAQTLQLEEKIAKADLIITGEGKVDAQTQYGKTAFGVVQLAKKYKKPVIAVAGTIEKDAYILYEKGFDVLISIVDKPMSLQQALKNVNILLENTGERIGRFILLKNY